MLFSYLLVMKEGSICRCECSLIIFTLFIVVGRGVCLVFTGRVIFKVLISSDDAFLASGLRFTVTSSSRCVSC